MDLIVNLTQQMVSSSQPTTDTDATNPLNETRHTENECVVCLESVATDVKYCKCKGSLKYCHACTTKMAATSKRCQTCKHVYTTEPTDFDYTTVKPKRSDVPSVLIGSSPMVTIINMPIFAICLCAMTVLGALFGVLGGSLMYAVSAFMDWLEPYISNEPFRLYMYVVIGYYMYESLTSTFVTYGLFNYRKYYVVDAVKRAWMLWENFPQTMEMRMMAASTVLLLGVFAVALYTVTLYDRYTFLTAWYVSALYYVSHGMALLTIQNVLYKRQVEHEQNMIEHETTIGIKIRPYTENETYVNPNVTTLKQLKELYTLMIGHKMQQYPNACSRILCSRIFTSWRFLGWVKVTKPMCCRVHIDDVEDRVVQLTKQIHTNHPELLQNELSEETLANFYYKMKRVWQSVHTEVEMQTASSLLNLYMLYFLLSTKYYVGTQMYQNMDVGNTSAV